MNRSRCWLTMGGALAFLGVVAAAAQGAEEGAAQKIVRDIQYAARDNSAASQTSLDVYAPANAKDRPIVVWIHGGGWRIGDKRGVQLKPQAFIDQGFVFVSINYRLYPEADYAGQAGDVASAIRWVVDNAQQHGGSAERIYLMGHSAGAHLAALTAVDDKYLRAEKLPLTTIKGVILLDGAGYDIPLQIEQAPLPRAKQLYTTVFSADKEKQQDASPLTHVAADKGIPPFLILHVARRSDSKRQSENLAAALNGAGSKTKVVAAAGKSHATINRELGAEGDEPTNEVFAFLAEIEGKGTADKE